MNTFKDVENLSIQIREEEHLKYPGLSHLTIWIGNKETGLREEFLTGNLEKKMAARTKLLRQLIDGIEHGECVK